MGDYTKSGEKIGTCGNAYYATLPMLQQLAQYAGEEEAQHYINPQNKCTFAFPFPMYDGKKVGEEISNFHEGQRAEFFFDLPATIESHHTHIVHHVHPRGGAGINLFIDCPHKDGKASSNFDKSTLTYRLTNQMFFNGSLHIVAECIYCGERNIFSKEEALLICEWIESRRHDTEEEKAYYLEISKRIKETYEEVSEPILFD